MIKNLFFSSLFLLLGSVNIFIAVEIFNCHNQMTELKKMMIDKEKNLDLFRSRMIDKSAITEKSI
jgi:hypothetical protein